MLAAVIVKLVNTPDKSVLVRSAIERNRKPLSRVDVYFSCCSGCPTPRCSPASALQDDIHSFVQSPEPEVAAIIESRVLSLSRFDAVVCA